MIHYNYERVSNSLRIYESEQWNTRCAQNRLNFKLDWEGHNNDKVQLKHFQGHNDKVQFKHFEGHPFSRSPIFWTYLSPCKMLLCFEYELNTCIPFSKEIWSMVRYMLLCYENELWMSYVMKRKCTIWPWKIFHKGHNNDKVQLKKNHGYPFFNDVLLAVFKCSQLFNCEK